MKDFISEYLEYTHATECPVIFSRWAAISGIAAILGRQYYFQHGHFNVYPNLYIQFIGTSGSRKSTTIKILKKTLTAYGYDTFGPDKSSKEKFLLNLAGETEGGFQKVESFLWDGPNEEVKEQYIMADEFNQFIGAGNLEFMSLLGVLWENPHEYKNEIKTGKSVCIPNPTINILSGNTPTSFNLCFPPEALGQGFFSRLILVQANPRGNSITFPESPATDSTEKLLNHLRRIKESIHGITRLTPEGKKLLDRIYKSRITLDDVRFDAYSTRRFDHLIKLSLIASASRLSCEIEARDVIYANTILTYTEHFMSKALGEFGKAKNSDVAHTVVQLIESSLNAMTFQDIWMHVANDLEKPDNLAMLLRNLVSAGRIQRTEITGESAFLPKRKLLKQGSDGLVDFNLLTEEEREIVL
jgi:hypothetical protein